MFYFFKNEYSKDRVTFVIADGRRVIGILLYLVSSSQVCIISFSCPCHCAQPLSFSLGVGMAVRDTRWSGPGPCL